MNVEVDEAQSHFNRILDFINQGEEVTILRASIPVAKLMPAEPSGGKRVLGWARGEFTVPDDFDAPLRFD